MHHSLTVFMPDNGNLGQVNSLYDLSLEQLRAAVADQPKYRINQLWDGLYRQGHSLGELSNVPKALRATLSSQFPTSLSLVTESVSDHGDTVKWLWALHDGARIETVLMHYEDRSTVCVSTQAGCAMNCSFCATGQAGFERHLSVGEIVEQVVRARQRAHPRRVSNVVFMGMGEPLANYNNLWASIERFQGDMGISARSLTVSTVGFVPGILRLKDEALPVNLAVSLHVAEDQRRNNLVPINRRYPLSILADALKQYLAAKGRRLSFEWSLIDGVNDQEIDAQQLAAYASPLRAHVNLIPLNPTPGYLVKGSAPKQVYWFRDRLVELGINATVRQNRGTDIDAACGQLRANHTLNESSVRLSEPKLKIQSTG